ILASLLSQYERKKEILAGSSLGDLIALLLSHGQNWALKRKFGKMIRTIFWIP
ncbi:hypothetical protein STEG23_001216, partial [Scotinomys teguina]